MVFVYQDESFGPGLDGAIRSALPMTRGPVALVLPDTVVTGPETRGKLLDALRQTDVPGWSVVAAEERDHDTLRQMGALAVTGTGAVLTTLPCDPVGRALPTVDGHISDSRAARVSQGVVKAATTRSVRRAPALPSGSRSGS